MVVIGRFPIEPKKGMYIPTPHNINTGGYPDFMKKDGEMPDYDSIDDWYEGD